jgi:hypothetical protein
VTGADGGPLDAPLNVSQPVAWIAYANRELQQAIEPVLQRLLRDHELG